MMQLETFFTVPEQTRLLIFAVLLGIPPRLCHLLHKYQHEKN